MNAIKDIKDLVIGKIYKFIYNEIDTYIFQLTRLDNDRMYCFSYLKKDKFYEKSVECYMVNCKEDLDKVYEADSLETQWFKECERQKKTIPISEINNNIQYECY